DSWVSTGQNMNISADQLQQIFGSSTMRDMASQLGMPQEQAGSTMAQVLPELINQLTPQGQVPANGDDEIAEGLSMLANPALLRRGGGGGNPGSCISPLLPVPFDSSTAECENLACAFRSVQKVAHLCSACLFVAAAIRSSGRNKYGGKNYRTDSA